MEQPGADGSIRLRNAASAGFLPCDDRTRERLREREATMRIKILVFTDGGLIRHVQRLLRDNPAVYLPSDTHIHKHLEIYIM